MRTWHYEIAVVGMVLITITVLFGNNWINWITTAAILFTFNHAQIGDRLQEKQANMPKPTVECYHKLNKIFFTKEILWIVAFILMKNWAAIVGSALFAVYPIWRRIYRKKIKPVN